MPNQCPSWKPPPGFPASGAFADLSPGFFRVMERVLNHRLRSGTWTQIVESSQPPRPTEDQHIP
jgi:hypothetical protein